MWINLIVALSNIFGVIPALYMLNKQLWISILFFNMTLASVLMHLSETKHGLPGIYPFNKYSGFFLNLDRVMAIGSALIMIFLVVYYEVYNVCIFGYVMVGVLLGWYSERVCESKIMFMVSHGLWHMIAFTSSYYVLSLIY